MSARAILAVLLVAATWPVVRVAYAAPSPPASQGKCQLTWPLPAFVTPLSWMDHHYPDRLMDGVMLRYDGATDANYDGHRGLDLPIPQGTPVMAAADGLVTYAAWDDAGGNGVGILHDNCRTFYFHNRALLVAAGQVVHRGDVIAYSGTTGNSTGPHLHFEARNLDRLPRSVDPYGWIAPFPDPWSFDQGVLWRGGSPEVIRPGPPASPVQYRAVRDYTPPERVLVRRACGPDDCVMYADGRLVQTAHGAEAVIFNMPSGRRAAAMDCFATQVACIVIDNWGDPYNVAPPSAPVPEVGDLPGVWPLRGAPAGIALDPRATLSAPSGTVYDSEGAAFRFGPPWAIPSLASPAGEGSARGY